MVQQQYMQHKKDRSNQARLELEVEVVVLGFIILHLAMEALG